MQNMFPQTFAYPTDLMDDLSRQMAASHASRRSSRASNPMRVVKPSSASNSPRSAASRRTTLSSEAGLARRRQQPVEPASDFSDPAKRALSRPLSWHPGFLPQEQQQQQQQYFSQHYLPPQYPFPALLQSQDLPDFCGQYSAYSPAPTAYSCSTSPSSFSPLALPTSAGLDSCSSYIGVDPWSMPQPSPPDYLATEPFPAYHNYAAAAAAAAAADTPLPVGVDWSSFASQAFSDITPPTPDLVPESQPAQPDVVSDEDDEADGEILVGMGLYDEPDKYAADAGLESPRHPISFLVGDAMPMGKGLKLEEEWAPPPSADEDDQENDEEEDDDDE